MADITLVGRLVEVYGLKGTPAKVTKLEAEISENPNWTEADVDGQTGYCIDYDGTDEVFMVMTFGGLLAQVPTDHLKSYEPPSPEKGGFDVAWPAGESDPSAFGAVIAETLSQKGYCVVQTFMSPEERQEASSGASRIKTAYPMLEESELDYMGRENNTRALQLEPDTPDKEPTDALARCDRQLTDLGLLLVPYTEEALGFQAFGRTRGLARTPYRNNAEKEQLKPKPTTEEDVEQDLVAKHITFMRSRKVCMMYAVNAEDGAMTLFAKDGTEVSLPISANKIILFCHDYMSYKYKASPYSMILQSWMLAPAPTYQVDLVVGTAENKHEVFGINGLPAPDTMKAQVMSLATRIPGNASDPDKSWNMWRNGTDACTRWGQQRFDEDIYYDPDPAMTMFGKAYTNHSGFLTDDEIFNLDNDFFDISDREASCMSINQRLLLEVGYSALHSAGWRRSSLNNKTIGCYVGDVGSDWHGHTGYLSMVNYDPEITATAVHNAQCTGRLAYVFGMRGANMVFDTACSASLYATHHAHLASINNLMWGIEQVGNLICGVNSVGATGYVGNCMGNILTHIGRCHTYDERADGYQRGEGCGTFFMQMSDDPFIVDKRIACIVGTCANHDGKSASLTAPSGPSQQQCLRHAGRMSQLDPDDYAFTECHGTGTALGDPIEMGAILAVYEDRENPLPHTCPKTNIGHLESAAGSTGLIKMMLGLIHQACAPNIHLKTLNPHMEQQGFPALFGDNLTPTGFSSGYSGVSSFGFGGANARAEMYASARAGPFCTNDMREGYVKNLDFISVNCPQCGGPMAWLDGQAIPRNGEKVPHHASLIREEFANYDICTNCYIDSNGTFRYGQVIQDADGLEPHETVHIWGSFDGFSDSHEMEPIGDGAHTCYITIGQSRFERFYLSVDGFKQSSIYPPTANGDASDGILGPDAAGKGKCWVINRTGSLPAGTVVLVTFTWADGRKKISWEPVTEEPVGEVLGSGYTHTCSVTGSYNSWVLDEMRMVKEDCYEKTIRIPESGKVEFRFLRDRSMDQQIYPSLNKAFDASIPVRGPSAGAGNRSFLVRGNRGEDLTLRLSLADGAVAVTASWQENETTWTSEPGYQELFTAPYGVTGSFNSWGYQPMTAHPTLQGVYTFTFTCSYDLQESFQIAVDGDASYTIHPQNDGARIAECIVEGPDRNGDASWVIDGVGGTTFEISLDFNQTDKRKMVYWKRVVETPEGLKAIGRI